MKIVSLSFDDGTIYDVRFIKLLNKYNLKATFNLNSGLDDFVWFYDERPVRRLILQNFIEVYKGHEVASHSLTHPYFSSLNKEEIIRQVNEDIKNLESTFNIKIEGFAFPFIDQTEENIETLKNNTNLTYIRYSFLSDDVKHKDKFHIHINALYDDKNIYDKLNKFQNSNNENGLFVIAGHSYEFEMKNDWKKIEALLIYLKKNNFNVLTLKDAMKEIF